LIPDATGPVINQHAGSPLKKTGEGPGIAPGGAAGEDLSIMDKASIGLEMLGDRLYQVKALKAYHQGKQKLIKELTRPFKEFFGIQASSSSPPADGAAIPAEVEKPKPYPGKFFGIFQSPDPSNDEFWEKHPVLHAVYLGGKLTAKVSRAVIRMGLPAAYAGSGKKMPIGGKFIERLLDRSAGGSAIDRAYDNFTRYVKMPGVSLALGIIGPAMGLSRVVDGINEYGESKESKNALQRMEGKADIASGALTAIKPLALLAIGVEGLHLFLNHRVKNKGMSPEKADRIMTRVLLTAAAPVGLAAYALLAPPGQKEPASP
jgi:hypothetical protein